eukprot:3534208-Pyramimonas_sp.AAC.1
MECHAMLRHPTARTSGTRAMNLAPKERGGGGVAALAGGWGDGGSTGYGVAVPCRNNKCRDGGGALAG